MNIQKNKKCNNIIINLNHKHGDNSYEINDSQILYVILSTLFVTCRLCHLHERCFVPNDFHTLRHENTNRRKSSSCKLQFKERNISTPRRLIAIDQPWQRRPRCAIFYKLITCFKFTLNPYFLQINMEVLFVILN